MQAGVPGRRVTRIAKLVADVTWWFMIGGAALAVVVVIFSPIGMPLHISIPNEAAGDLLPLTSPDTVLARDVKLTNVEATLLFETSEPWPLSLVRIVGTVPALAAFLFGVGLVRSFLREVLDKRVFTAANAQRLSRLGWLMIAAGLAVPVINLLYTSFLLRWLNLEGVPLGTGIDSIRTVVPGILVLAVAAAWRYGVALQQDHDLTV